MSRCGECPKWVKDNCDGNLYYEECIDKLQDALWSIDIPTWIPCSEKLPNEKGEYLVTYHPCHWDNVRYERVIVGIDTFRGKTTWAKKKYQRVIAWMPLPQPYKEKNDE